MVSFKILLSFLSLSLKIDNPFISMIWNCIKKSFVRIDASTKGYNFFPCYG